MPVIDLAHEPSIADITASVCIVGSGPAGGFLAAELARTTGGIVLLESGGAATQSRTDDVVASVSLPAGAGANLGFSERLGGTSDVWSGRLALLEAVDFTARPWVPHSGWPIQFETVAPYYDKAAAILGLRGLSAFAPDRHALAPALAELIESGDIELKPFVWLDPPFRVESHLKDAAARTGGNLTVLTSARVRSLHERAGSPAVEYASVAAPGGRTIRVYARVFVLAAGGIGTPRILLNSTDRSASGLGNGADLVGRFLSTHPKADLGSITIDSAMPTASPLFEKRRMGASLARLGLGLSAAAQAACAGLNHYVQITPEPKRDGDGKPQAVDAEDSLAGRAPGDGALRAGWLAGIRRALGATSARNTRAKAGRRFVLRAFLDQFPDPANRVSLASDVDLHGDRKVRVSWSFSDADRRTVREFFSRLECAFDRHGVGRVQFDPLLADGNLPLVGLHSHLMGTTRMGDSARSGVVDRDGRVFECKNLYIAGPSTFPTAGYANPFLTIAALSLRLADHLRQSMDAR